MTPHRIDLIIAAVRQGRDWKTAAETANEFGWAVLGKEPLDRRTIGRWFIALADLFTELEAAEQKETTP